MTDHRFTRAAVWALVAAAFSRVGLMHAPLIAWGAAPTYALGWLIAAVIFFSARWWHGPYPTEKPAQQEVPRLVSKVAAA